MTDRRDDDHDRPTTFLHRLHPLVKMAASFALTIAAFSLDEALPLGLLVAFLAGLFLVARVRVPARAAVGVLVFLAVASGVNYLVTRDAAGASHYALRVVAVLLAMPILAATTAPQDTVRALARCRLPQGLAVALLLIWRFFPVLARESAAIRTADHLRGSPAGRRPRAWSRAFLVPMAFVAVDYADRVALALELRGFDPSAPRSWYRSPRLGWRDLAFVSMVAALIALAALLQAGRPIA